MLHSIINKLKTYDWKKIDVLLLIVVFMLCIIGAFTLKLAGTNMVVNGYKMGDYYMRAQFKGLLLGLVVIITLTLIDYHFICQFAPYYFIFGIILTLLTKSPIGYDYNTDAKRWIRIGGIVFQPTELMKIIYIIFFAWLLSKFQRKIVSAQTILICIGLTFIPFLAVLSQPDLSSSLVILFVMFVVLYTAGASYKHIGIFFGIPIPIFSLLFWYLTRENSITYNKLWNVYQFRRVIAWLTKKPEFADNLNYQSNLSVNAIASGGLYGKYLADSGERAGRVYDSVSVRESDFIWAVVGEEFGFLGCLLIIILYAILIFRCIQIAKNAQDYLGKLIAVGISAMFMFQMFTNIAVATFLFPNTGLPLPFLSSGLSSMLSSMISVGLLINISIQPAKSSKGGLQLRSHSMDMEII
ncbi:MAG: FtsW/RodA/SpoVE family cell cycle protein [Lachnospiraceae bacterium]|nr:FtsW/RodA/SpoVE family cell cycle protein [Lachnospiraceae bacterium]